MYPWVKFLINNNMKFVVFGIWTLTIPLYFIARMHDWLKRSAQDALDDLQDLKAAKKGKV